MTDNTSHNTSQARRRLRLGHHLRRNLVAYLALFIAVSMTPLPSWAAGKITSKQIKNNTIKSIDVRDNNLKGVDILDGALTGADVANGSVTGTDVANGSLTQGDFSSSPIGVVRGYVYSGVAAPPLDTPGEITGDYVYNTGGGPVTRTRTDVGKYTLTFGGLDMDAGNIQITSYGSTEDVFCKLGSWGGSSANVVCFDAAGALADSRFTLAFIR